MEESIVQIFENDRFRTRIYVDANGTVWLHIEDVARSLGFINYQEKASATSGRKIYAVIRWERVNRYIAEIKAHAKSELIQSVAVPVDKNGFIPENLVYRLAMKANNDVAEDFQSWLADEVLPALHKNGYYVSQKFSADSVNIDSSTELSATASTIPAEKKIELLLEFAKLTTLGKLRNQFLREAALLLTGKKF